MSRRSGCLILRGDGGAGADVADLSDCDAATWIEDGGRFFTKRGANARGA